MVTLSVNSIVYEFPVFTFLCITYDDLYVDMDKELSSATVTFDEFIEMVTPRMLNRDSREEIMKVFALFDDDNTGAISFKNLKRVATELGTRMFYLFIHSSSNCDRNFSLSCLIVLFR